jgi:CheY-like chemotaxis protein
MDRDALYTLIKATLESLQKDYPDVRALPTVPPEDQILEAYGIDEVVFSDFIDDVEIRLGGRRLNLEIFLNRQEYSNLSFRKLLDHLVKVLTNRIKKPLVVYVDDEEENLFVFKRKFGKELNLKTFTDPQEAFQFITSDSDVALVITDEVMPGMNGNLLCDKVKEIKPAMKFILITGNPDNDDDLMYNTLRGNRFFEFIRKPMDLENKGNEYLKMIQGLTA